MTFNARTVINSSSVGNNLKVFYVGYDLARYRDHELTELMMDTLVDFAFGYHIGIITHSYSRKLLKEAAKSIYKIPEFSHVKWVYVDSGEEMSDCELKEQDKYLKKGEFGEMILHLLLRDFFATEPLLSKIHFKDTDNAVVHGFDIVHIGKELNDPNKVSLYLGESKLYSRKDGNSGLHGIGDLVKDVANHFSTDFLNREIALINKKKDAFIHSEDYKDKNTETEYVEFLARKKAWFEKFDAVVKNEMKLQDFLSSVTIPLICTYQSSVFDGCTDENDEKFIKILKDETDLLKTEFDKQLAKLPVRVGEPIKTQLNIILVLFPIPSKKNLVKMMHEKLYKEQG